MKPLKSLVALCAMTLLPLGDLSSWTQFDYGSIAKNKVIHKSETLTIEVNQSASPLIYRLNQKQKISRLEIKATLLSELPTIPKDCSQGDRRCDDYIVRVGLIVPGPKKLNWVQRQLAPVWLVNMEKLLPDSTGVKRVEFISTCRQNDKLKQRQRHYLNDILYNECVALIEKKGSIDLEKSFTNPLEIIGFWIAIDGDQTKSQFKVRIDKIAWD